MHIDCIIQATQKAPANHFMSQLFTKHQIIYIIKCSTAGKIVTNYK